MASTSICSVSDCGNPPNGRRGMCAPHYQRLCKYGDPTAGRWRVPARDRIGSKFGRLTVISIVPRAKGQRGSTRAMCRCECGGIGEKDLALVVSGHTKSCGCYNSDVVTARNTTHGLTDSPEYTIWAGMKARCGNPKHPAYVDYGGRGIAVCERWASSFVAFLDDMGERPGPAMSLDRIDPNKGYAPENCRWADSATQAKNTRRARLYSFGGEMLNLREIGMMVGIRASTVSARLSRGWSIDKAARTPLGRGSEGRRFMVGDTHDLLNQLRGTGLQLCLRAADEIERLVNERREVMTDV